MPASTAIANNLIRDVWRDNLEEEFEKIRQLIPIYNYVSIGLTNEFEVASFIVLYR